MTVVAEDKQGLYVLVGERVGRPHMGQGQGLKAGQQVRAMLKPQGLKRHGVLVDAVRVRWGGGTEQLWPAYVSRKTQKYAEPPKFRVGQKWRRQDDRIVTVGWVYPDGTMVTEGGSTYNSEGHNISSPNPARNLKHLVEDAPK